MTAVAVSETPPSAAEQALSRLSLDVRRAPIEQRVEMLHQGALALVPYLQSGELDPVDVEDEIYQIANDLGLGGEPGSESEHAIAMIAQITIPAEEQEPARTTADIIRGWELAHPVDRLKYIEESQAEPTDFGPTWEPVLAPEHQPEAVISALVFESAASWRGLPLEPVRWLATNRIPAADVAILSGDGGQGKTTTAVQLAVSVAHGLGDWLGTTCERGDVMFFSGEENRATIRNKLAPIAAARGLDPDDLAGLSFHFPEDPLLGGLRRDGTIGPTGTMQALETAVKETRPALLIIDSVAAVFGGNYIDRVQVRTFVSMLRKMAEAANCAILLLDHPSLSGMQNGSGRSGSMDWRNAVRAFMYLRPTDNDDGTKGRELEVMKINSGPCGEVQKLRWDAGCFVLEGSASAPHLAASHSTAERVYLECLDAITGQGRHVCHAPGRGYAPKTFAETPQANGLTWRAFQAAPERLFAAGTIENVAYGPKSKGTKCIARKV